MRVLSLVALVAVLFLWLGDSAHAEVEPNSIRSCAAHLPEGKAISFSIVGTIDTTPNEPAVAGEITLDDGSDSREPPAWAKELGAFLTCMDSVIGGQRGEN